MNRRIYSILLGLLLLASCNGSGAGTQSETRSGTTKGMPVPVSVKPSNNILFGAYYTRLQSNETFEKQSRTGKYGDIVVRLADGQLLEFWRGTSYLPRWRTAKGVWNVPEVVTRKGDGTQSMPDRVNMFSHVKIIESTEQRAVVLWRYLPEFSAGNPKKDINDVSTVEEIFSIEANGKVSRTIRRGTGNWDEWQDVNNRISQTFTLTPDGIQNIQTQAAPPPAALAAVQGNPKKSANVIAPKFWLKFDEGVGNTTREELSQNLAMIPGHKTNWKKGISGTAIALDGYNNYITFPGDKAPKITTELTMEAWLSMGAYPWFVQPIIHKGTLDNMQSYGLYVSEQGELSMVVKQAGVVQEIFWTGPFKTFTWTHVAGTFNGTTGDMHLYVNGVLVASENAGRGNIDAGVAPVHIGHGLSDSSPPGAAANIYTLDALLDEVRIYDKAMSAGQVKQSFDNFYPGNGIASKPDMQPRLIPEGKTTGKFGARYEKLEFYDTWEQLMRDGPYADIVVEYGNSPLKTIFWRAASYDPCHYNGAKGRFCTEFNENFKPHPDGSGRQFCCAEPMSDKKHLYSHARIIENTDARVVVHWRYPQSFVGGENNHYDPTTGWGDWSDWYMYIYPDGIASFEMVWWTDNLENRVEWAEPMMLLGPGEQPEALIPFVNTVTSADQTREVNWNWSRNFDVIDLLHNTEPKPQIQTINITGSEYKPVILYDDKNLEFWGPYNDFNRYSHWPAGQKNSHGESDYGFGTRTGHTSMLKPIPFTRGYQSGSIEKGVWKKNIRLEGMSNRDLSSLRRLHRSWMNAPALKSVQGGTGRYSLEQRAFILNASMDTLSFVLEASESQPLDNPAFVIKNWGSKAKANITINGSVVTNLRQGVITDVDGTFSKVLYLPLTATSHQTVTISKVVVH